MSILLNDGKTGGDAMNSIWYTKQRNLKQGKQKLLPTVLWTRPKNPPADIIQIGGHSMQTLSNNIMAGSAAKPTSHPHLQELVAPATIQPQRHMNEVHMMELNMLIQRTA